MADTLHTTEMSEEDYKELAEHVRIWKELSKLPRTATDPDEILSEKEDAHLNELTAVIGARRLGKERYDNADMKAVFDCEYEELVYPTFYQDF